MVGMLSCCCGEWSFNRKTLNLSRTEMAPTKNGQPRIGYPILWPVRILLTSLFLVEEGQSLEYSISPIRK